MGAVSSIVLGLALRAVGWWLSVSCRRREAWVGPLCIAAAVCFLVNGAIAALGRAVVLNAITAAGLWAVGLPLLLAGPGRYRPWALAVIAIGGLLAVFAWSG